MLYWNTVSPLLKAVLKDIMQANAFNSFRLVGGTALSLQLGHRMSVDIDLFTDAPYGSIDFQKLEDFLKSNYRHVHTENYGLIGIGASYTVGKSQRESIKPDLYYTDPYIQPPHLEDGIRLATVEEIASMKIDVIQRGGRKKDFWDIHEILEQYKVTELLDLHLEKYPFSHDYQEIRKQLTNFHLADADFDPICLKNKVWELIKYDIIVMMGKV